MKVGDSGPPTKGRKRLLTARQLIEEFFPEEAQPTPRWVRENIPGSVRIGRRYLWDPDLVEDHLFGGGTP